MADFPFDVVGFDLDGTLLDTSADLADATNHALALVGRPTLTREAVKPMIGRGAKHMLEQGLAASGGFDEEVMARAYPALLTYYEANISRGSVPYPGLLDAVTALDARRVKLAVVTNKFERFAIKLLTELGLIGRFATVIGGDTMGKGNAKPSALPIREMVARCGGGRAVFLGDSIYDMLAAKNAGIPSIAVRFGFLMQPIEELGADAVLDHYDDLMPLLETLAATSAPVAAR